MHYLVTRLPSSKRWNVSRLVASDPESLCNIGTFTSRKEAVQCARLLAGWRGKVSIKG